MFKSHVIAPVTFAALLLAAACSGVPDGVLDKEDMASLMADIHKGESAIALSDGRFYSDSMRYVVRKSIYDAHGVTAEEVDSSLRYYAHHIEDYQEVYDMVIEKLKTQYDETGAYVVDNMISLSGDTVDVWTSARRLAIGPQSPSRFLTFELTPDDNWKPGDTYVWTMKTLNNETPVSMRLLADYSDGTIEYLDNMSQPGEGWVSMTYTLDTVSTPLRFYGIAEFKPSADEYIYVDSISLSRRHKDDGIGIIRYRYKRFKP